MELHYIQAFMDAVAKVISEGDIPVEEAGKVAHRVNKNLWQWSNERATDLKIIWWEIIETGVAPTGQTGVILTFLGQMRVHNFHQIEKLLKAKTMQPARETPYQE